MKNLLIAMFLLLCADRLFAAGQEVGVLANARAAAALHVASDRMKVLVQNCYRQPKDSDKKKAPSDLYAALPSFAIDDLTALARWKFEEVFDTEPSHVKEHKFLMASKVVSKVLIPSSQLQESICKILNEKHLSAPDDIEKTKGSSVFLQLAERVVDRELASEDSPFSKGRLLPKKIYSASPIDQTYADWQILYEGVISAGSGGVQDGFLADERRDDSLKKLVQIFARELNAARCGYVASKSLDEDSFKDMINPRSERLYSDVLTSKYKAGRDERQIWFSLMTEHYQSLSDIARWAFGPESEELKDFTRWINDSEMVRFVGIETNSCQRYREWLDTLDDSPSLASTNGESMAFLVKTCDRSLNVRGVKLKATVKSGKEFLSFSEAMDALEASVYQKLIRSYGSRAPSKEALPGDLKSLRTAWSEVKLQLSDYAFLKGDWLLPEWPCRGSEESCLKEFNQNPGFTNDSKSIDPSLMLSELKRRAHLAQTQYLMYSTERLKLEVAIGEYHSRSLVGCKEVIRELKGQDLVEITFQSTKADFEAIEAKDAEFYIYLANVDRVLTNQLLTINTDMSKYVQKIKKSKILQDAARFKQEQIDLEFKGRSDSSGYLNEK
ncbi:MAG: hypothetical protein EOP06_03865 [Proteobacteria bacterium]|nr:MAG: hypothetical protein EOP06_03865 [Pseudomonadota bacterium]